MEELINKVVPERHTHEKIRCRLEEGMSEYEFTVHLKNMAG